MVKLANRSDKPDNTTEHQNVQIIIDPKTVNLNKVVHDVLEINRLVTEHIPLAKMKSVTIDDHFAVVNITAPKNPAATGANIRLYKIGGIWKIKGCAFIDEIDSGRYRHPLWGIAAR